MINSTLQIYYSIFSHYNKKYKRTINVYHGFQCCVYWLKRLLRSLDEYKNIWSVNNAVVIYIDKGKDQQSEHSWMLLRFKVVLCRFIIKFSDVSLKIFPFKTRQFFDGGYLKTQWTRLLNRYSYHNLRQRWSVVFFNFWLRCLFQFWLHST